MVSEQINNFTSKQICYDIVDGAEVPVGFVATGENIALTSIPRPPPARAAEFPLIVLFTIVTTASSTHTPPPSESVPAVALPDNVLRLIVTAPVFE